MRTLMFPTAQRIASAELSGYSDAHASKAASAGHSMAGSQSMGSSQSYPLNNPVPAAPTKEEKGLPSSIKKDLLLGPKRGWSQQPRT